MGKALLTGLVGRGFRDPTELHVVEPDPNQQAAVARAVSGISISNHPVSRADAVIAVKPGVVKELLPRLDACGVTRVVSIAAGVRISAIEAGLPPGAAVIRAMPNTAALIGKGIAAIAAGTAATAEDLSWAESILATVGLVVRVDEADLDAVTGLSGSGPAYLFRLAEALTAAGVEQGLAPPVADALTRQTLLGAAALLTETGKNPACLRDDVTTRGGTTAAGLAVLEEAGFMGLMSRVVAAATQRSRELGA